MRALTWMLAAVLEAALLVAVGVAGYRFGGDGLRAWLAALSATGIVIALWGLLAAPKAPHRLSGAALLGFKTAAFALGAAAVAIWGAVPAAIYALTALAYLGLATRLRVL